MLLLKITKHVYDRGPLIGGDRTEVRSFNQPKEHVIDWFFESLLVMRDQLLDDKVLW
jgi:hypothetical protein